MVVSQGREMIEILALFWTLYFSSTWNSTRFTNDIYSRSHWNAKDRAANIEIFIYPHSTDGWDPRDV